MLFCSFLLGGQVCWGEFVLNVCSNDPRNQSALVISRQRRTPWSPVSRHRAWADLSQMAPPQWTPSPPPLTRLVALSENDQFLPNDLPIPRSAVVFGRQIRTVPVQESRPEVHGRRCPKSVRGAQRQNHAGGVHTNDRNFLDHGVPRWSSLAEAGTKPKRSKPRRIARQAQRDSARGPKLRQPSSLSNFGIQFEKRARLSIPRLI